MHTQETHIAFVYDDGGRRDAGFKGTTGDCTCRAVAIATGKPYIDVYNDLNELGKRERKSLRRRGKSSARTGVYKPTIRRYMASLGWEWHSTMGIGTGTRVHLRADELPKGRLVVMVSRHTVAVIDGVIHDLSDCSRDGSRAVYGFFTPPGWESGDWTPPPTARLVTLAELQQPCNAAYRGPFGYATCGRGKHHIGMHAPR